MGFRALNDKLFRRSNTSNNNPEPKRSQSAAAERTVNVKKTRRLSAFSIYSLGKSDKFNDIAGNASDGFDSNTNLPSGGFGNDSYSSTNASNKRFSSSFLEPIPSPTQHPYRQWLTEQAPDPNVLSPSKKSPSISTTSFNRFKSSLYRSKSAAFRSTPVLSSLLHKKPEQSAIAENDMTYDAIANSATTTTSTTVSAANVVEEEKVVGSTTTTNAAPSYHHHSQNPPPIPYEIMEKNNTKPAIPNNTQNVQHRSAQEWKEKGAASAVKTEADSKGQMRTIVIKKGVEDFDFGKTLGHGSYSTVVCGSDKQTLRQYAIKILDKRHIIKEKKVKYVEIEKRTLNRLGDHPGIIPLYYTFQDEDSLYFVLDYASNGELLGLIKRLGSLSEECVQYYGAQLLDAIQFMHSRGVIHRDLKPENILLDDKMRIKVTDFGTAKLLNRERDALGQELDSYPQNVRASSFVGTAEYVSPELLAEKYVTKSCDIWAYGCIIYQMVAGRPPFKANNEYQTFQKIVKLQFAYPPQFSMVIRDLVKHILVLNPNQRYTALQIKQHHFFNGQDWSRAVIWKKPPPRLLPYTPSIVPNTRPANQSSRQKSAIPDLVPTIPTTPTTRATSNNPVYSAALAAATLAAPATKPSSNNNNSIQPLLQPHPQTQLSSRPIRSHPQNGSPSAPHPQQQHHHQQQQQHHQQPIYHHSAPQISTPAQTIAIPPLSQVDRELKAFRIHRDERILKIGSVIMSSTNTIMSPHQLASPGAHHSEDDDIGEKEPSRISRLFAGNRRKKRVLFVTSFGRLVVIASVNPPQKLYLDMRVVLPQVSVHKSSVNSFIVEGNGKTFSFQDGQGSSDWITMINKARYFVENSQKSANSNNHNNNNMKSSSSNNNSNNNNKSHLTALTAAALAASAATPSTPANSAGRGDGGGPAPRKMNNSTPDMRIVVNHPSAGRRSAEIEVLTNGTSNMYLKGNEKMRFRR